jgi:H+/Cl- antiporter ClcA
MIKNLFISICFGVLIGITIACYSLGLEKIAEFHSQNKMYSVFLVVAFLIIYAVKRWTLFFPTTVQEVMDADDVEQRHWSRGSFLFNLLGSWLSHFAGASLGREGTILVLSSSLAQSLKLNWNYYKPIILSSALACVLGQPLLVWVILLELFKTDSNQKLFAFFMAWVGFLVIKTLNIPTLLPIVDLSMDIGFLNKLWVVFLVGAMSGMIMHGYKEAHVYLSRFFKRHAWVSIAVVLGLSWIFIQPQIKPLHSLGLTMLGEIYQGQIEMPMLLMKLIFTLLFVSLGFIGGDFVPMIILGSGFGVIAAKTVGVDYRFGLVMGCLSFFTAGTRLKWTAVWMVFFISGFSAMLWAYLALSFARQLSGPLSLYTKKMPTKSFMETL